MRFVDLPITTIAFAAVLAVFAAGCSDHAFCFNCDGAGGAGGSAGLGSGGAKDVCVETCAEGQACCLGSCIDVQTDAKNCGMCTLACGSGVCTDGMCSLTATCGMGTADCNGNPADGCETVTTDAKNCGACNVVCDATQTCTGKACACLPDAADCDANPKNGCETKSATDAKNCGACGKVCSVTAAQKNATASCAVGACGITCNPGFADCNGKPDDGCEVDIGTDSANCGACNAMCPASGPGLHGALGCQADATTGKGACTHISCDMGYGDCNGDPKDGCEVSLLTDLTHCGDCATKCETPPNGAPACTNGFCGTSSGPDACTAPFGNCDPNVPGCETSLDTDKDNCGLCGNACTDMPGPNATSACVFFSCALVCADGFGNCFGDSDGCETDLRTTVEHCGACDTPCDPIDHGVVICDSSKCGVGVCDKDYGDCNGKIDDGCETSFKTDADHCGKCAAPCDKQSNADRACVDGSCALGACDAGFADCDGTIGTGCEKNVLDDPNNCGGCNVVCGSGACSNGACVCTTGVLIIPDDAQAATNGPAVLQAAIAAIPGFHADIAPVPSFQYDGTQIALDPTVYGAVVLLAGGPAKDSYTADMPAGGQKAIVDFVRASNGLVLTEWAALQVASGHWSAVSEGDGSGPYDHLSDFVLLSRTQAFSGQVTYVVDPAFKTHPVWTGLPDSFTVSSSSNVGVARFLPGIKRVATSPDVLEPVAILDLPSVGRVVHIAHAGDYNPFGWDATPASAKANLVQLIVNGVQWTARCNN